MAGEGKRGQVGASGQDRSSALGRLHGLEGITKSSEAQTIALQPPLATDALPQLSHWQRATLMSAMMKLLERTPTVN